VSTTRRHIKIWVSEEEKKRIAANAAACGMSMSAYAKSLALGHKPVCLNNLNELDKVYKLNADLGRLGGLLKMLLTNDEWLRDMSVGRGMAIATIEDTLFNLRCCQEELRIMIEAVVDNIVSHKE
jgi:hypothetical protein